MSNKSDIISKLIFQLRRTGVIPAADRLAALEARVATLDTWVATFEEQLKGLEGKSRK